MNEENGYKYTKTDFCAVIFAICVLIIGYFVSTFIQNSMSIIPEGFGPPAIIVWVPMIMSSIPLILCIYLMATADKRARAKSVSSDVYRYRDDTIVYTGDYEIHKEQESKEDDPVYLIPTNCPSCDGALNAHEVEWIGPLQAKCPHCGKTVKAQKRI